MRALAKRMEESMGLCIDSELLYKSLSKAKSYKNGRAHCGRRANGERKSTSVYTTRWKFKVSNVGDDHREGVSEGEVAKMGLNGLASVGGGKRRVITMNGLETSYCRYPRRGNEGGREYIW